MTTSPSSGARGPGLATADATTTAFASSRQADKDNNSSDSDFTATTVSQLVMAEQITHDVVNAAQSMGDSSPIGVNATTTNESSAGAAPDTTTINKSSHDLYDPSNSTSTKDDALQDKTSAPETTSRDEGTPAAVRCLLRRTRHDLTGDQLATEGSEQSKSKDASVDRSKEAILNGTGLSTEDLAAQHLAADTSGGSDTDTSRAGKDGAKPKKPTSFKSVSVTKNFLAKTAVSAPSKVGEKGKFVIRFDGKQAG